MDEARHSDEFVLIGTLQRHEIEGGIWVLQLDHLHPSLGGQVELCGYRLTPDGEITHGAHVRVCAVELAEQLGFSMSGPRLEARSVEPI